MATRKRFDPRSALPGSPFLTHVTLQEDRVQAGVHPFTVPWLLSSLDLQLSAPVTFLVGENGTGKSTLLEAIAWSVGFGAQGGNRDQSFAENADGYALGRALRLSWRQKVSGGFFLRAETFFNFATYLEDVGSPFVAYGGRSLHQQSHGEAFLSLFQHRFEDGLYLLDEPEAALSPQRQLARVAPTAASGRPSIRLRSDDLLLLRKRAAGAAFPSVDIEVSRRGKTKHGLDVLTTQLREIGQYCLIIHAAGQILQYIGK